MTVFQASIVLPAKDPPPYCFPRCFPPFRLQNLDDRADIFSALPQRDDAPSKIGIQGGRRTFALTTTVNSLSKITLRIRFSPSKYSLVSTSAFFTRTSTVSTRTSTILRSIDTRVVWVTIFNHYCILSQRFMTVIFVMTADMKNDSDVSASYSSLHQWRFTHTGATV